MAPVKRKENSKSIKKSKDHAPETVLDRINSIVDSPLRLAIFCAALLIISLATGMLIGDFVKEDTSSGTAIADLPARPDLDLAVKPKSLETEEQKSPTSGTRPVDAVAYEEGFEYPQTADVEETPVANRETDLGEVIASLPPDAIPDRSENLPPWKRYAALSEPAVGKPVIAIVIDDVGLSKQRVNDLVALPKVLTLAFLPYASDLEKSAKLTRARGHEVMLHLPMEPLRASADPGPDALLDRLTVEEIRTTTIKNLDRFSGYVGVNNHMGSKFTSNEKGMAVMMDVLKERELLFLDSRTTATSKGYNLAKERGMLTGIRDVFLDNEANEAAILKQLEVAEKIANEKGTAIAIGHPYKETIAALTRWMPIALKKGIQFVPVSYALSIKTNN